MIEETINEFLRGICNLALMSSDFAIRSRQKDAPRPIGPYCDVDMVSSNSVGWEEFEHNNESDMVRSSSKGLRELVFSIGFYRDNAIDNASKVRSALVRESIQSLFLQAKLGMIRRSEIRRISEALENGWEERAQFDVFLSAVESDSDLIYSVESVDISGEFQKALSSITFDIEV